MGMKRFYHVNGTRVTRRTPDGTERDMIFIDLERVFRRQRERIKIRLGLIERKRHHGSDDSANSVEE